MTKLIIYKGLPASGKSTEARKLAASSADFVRVNRDDIRESIHGGAPWKPSREKMTVAVRNAMIHAGLKAGKTVISDDTNLDPKVEKELRQIAAVYQCAVEVVDLTHVSPTECIKRDLARPRSVGASVIWDMYRRYLKPEGVVQDEKLPHCILVDMDGTLAHIGDRSPYEDHKAHLDTVNGPVAEMITGYLAARPDCKLIIMSGRDSGRSREATATWLKANFPVEPHMIVMRVAGDERSDNIVKKELFNEYIRDKFYVEFIVDDRDKVVQMWRDELGLPCFQVFWGDF